MSFPYISNISEIGGEGGLLQHGRMLGTLQYMYPICLCTKAMSVLCFLCYNFLYESCSPKKREIKSVPHRRSV